MARLFPSLPRDSCENTPTKSTKRYLGSLGRRAGVARHADRALPALAHRGRDVSAPVGESDDLTDGREPALQHARVSPKDLSEMEPSGVSVKFRPHIEMNS